MEFNHYSVLLKETIENLDIKPDGIYVDGTLGGGGHANVAGAQLKGSTDQLALIQIKELLTEMYEQGDI